MPFNEFWFENHRFYDLYLKQFKESEKRRIQEQLDLLEFKAWYSGIYVRDALLSTVGNMFNKGKPNKYPDKPYYFKEKDEEIKENKEVDKSLEDENLRLLNQNYMEMLKWTEYYNQRNKSQDGLQS